MNSRRVAWLHRSPVYHGPMHKTRSDNGTLYAPCGVVLSCARYRAQHGTARDAEKLGLRPCRRCR